jgi:glutaredoxin
VVSSFFTSFPSRQTITLRAVYLEDGDLIKVILTRLTKHSTFPNIILRGHSIGGFDDLQALHDAGKLEELFEENGLSVHGSR